jgi:hypothetical protein
MMLKAHLQPVDAGPVLVVGPAPYIRLKRGALLAGPDDRPVAVLRDGKWEARSGSYVALTFPVKVLVRFQRHGRECAATRGPLLGVQVDVQAVRHGVLLDHCLARLSERGRHWLLYPLLRPCDNLVFEPGECETAWPGKAAVPDRFEASDHSASSPRFGVPHPTAD